MKREYLFTKTARTDRAAVLAKGAVKMNSVTSKFPTAEVIQTYTALLSSRDSGFDLNAAIGEPVDNSIEARAREIRIQTDQDGNKVNTIAIADDGVGIDFGILAHVLSYGYSTRYNQRNGLGRFGVGLKLAALSQGRRIDVYTRKHGDASVGHTYLDLDLVANGSQKDIVVDEVESFPDEYIDLMRSRKGEPYASGTLVVWSKVDRLVDGGRYGTSIKERLQALTKFLARAYRKFIDAGLYIELNGREITLHDPLFLLDNPRVAKIFDEDLRGEIIEETDLVIEGNKVHVVVSLLPAEMRRASGVGGRPWPELYIADNESKVSILRQGREIYYDIIPKLLPGGKDDGGVDRFVGVEVSFPAALDDYFQVRNVKRGAEPVDKLRNDLRTFLKRPVEQARKRVRALWEEVEKAERTASGEHKKSMDAVKRAEETSPRGRAGGEVTQEEAKKVIDDLLADVGIDVTTEPEKAEEIRKQVEDRNIVLVDGSWPGKEMLEISHLNAKAIVTLNHRHPFFREIYDPVKAIADKDPSEVSNGDCVTLMRRVQTALDVLFMAYAKAENMHDDPERQFSDLRSYWGQFTQAYVRELLREM